MTNHKVRWQGKWIWLSGLADTSNTYVFFRKIFRCNPGKKPFALLHITAGHFYRVYINGEFIGRGPDRSYFRDKIFHSYDISRLLKKGENIIAAQCHYLGHDENVLMERHASGPAGLIAQIELNGKVVARTDETWKTVRNTAYSMHTLPPTFHREWREDFFAAKEPKNWQALSFDDRFWNPAKVIAPAEGGPWTRLVPKETDELTAEIIKPINAYIDYPMYLKNETPEYLGYAFFNPIRTKPIRFPGDLRVWNKKQKSQKIIFDMGRVVAGYPRIDISKCNGGKIDVYYGCDLSMTHWDTIHLGKCPLVWTPFTLRGGRYFRLDISGAREPVSIRSVRWVRTNYPVEKRGRFNSSDKVLNAIWNMCVCSAETCGMEHIVDCVGREQVLWMMDFRFQAPQHYYYFGDTALARKCFRQFAVLQFNNGHILAYGPSARPKEEILAGIRGKKPHDWFGFNFYFIIAVWEHYQFTGDKKFLEEFYPVCRRCLGYYRSNEKNGFVHPGSIKGSSFVEWGYKGYVKNKNAAYSFTQALYYGARAAYQKICAEIGKKAEAAKTAERAKRLQRKFFETFVDSRTNRIADCVVGARRMMKNTAHPYIAAARFLENIPSKALNVWLKAISNRRLRPPRTGIGNTLAAEALMRHGKQAEAIRHISDYWGAMVEAGLPQTPEFFDMRAPKGSQTQWAPGYSMCHSYASLAGVLLQKIVLGARVEGKRVVISPCFARLASAKGVVPTTGGDVQISWRRRGKAIDLAVKAPKAVTVCFEPLNNKEKVNFRLETLK